jgi:hypothetical protein
MSGPEREGGKTEAELFEELRELKAMTSEALRRLDELEARRESQRTTT